MRSPTMDLFVIREIKEIDVIVVPGAVTERWPDTCSTWSGCFLPAPRLLVRY